MRLARWLPIVLTLSWALWFGGLITLFLAVTSLFDTFAPDRTTAGTAAAAIFHRFEIYQLVLAAVAVIAAAMWLASWRWSRLVVGGRPMLLLVLLALAAGMALMSTVLVSSRIEHLRERRLTDTPEFRRLHGTSMTIYNAEAALLLAAGLVLPGTVGGSAGLLTRPHPPSQP